MKFHRCDFCKKESEVIPILLPEKAFGISGRFGREIFKREIKNAFSYHNVEICPTCLEKLLSFLEQLEKDHGEK